MSWMVIQTMGGSKYLGKCNEEELALAVKERKAVVMRNVYEIVAPMIPIAPGKVHRSPILAEIDFHMFEDGFPPLEKLYVLPTTWHVVDSTEAEKWIEQTREAKEAMKRQAAQQSPILGMEKVVRLPPNFDPKKLPH